MAFGCGLLHTCFQPHRFPFSLASTGHFLFISQLKTRALEAVLGALRHSHRRSGVAPRIVMGLPGIGNTKAEMSLDLRQLGCYFA